MNTFASQYKLVKEAREVVFRLSETLAPEHYIQPMENFGHGSVRNTQAHIVDTYIHWIANFALEKSIPYLSTSAINTVGKMRNEFAAVDRTMDEFLVARFNADTIVNTLPNRGEVSSNSLALFTHVITHEFHHKGQLVSMIRMLGYHPPDTDLVRF